MFYFLLPCPANKERCGNVPGTLQVNVPRTFQMTVLCKLQQRSIETFQMNVAGMFRITFLLELSKWFINFIFLINWQFVKESSSNKSCDSILSVTWFVVTRRFFYHNVNAHKNICVHSHCFSSMCGYFGCKFF
jgi:hypothetical protein